jgi:hypothetical protein
MLLMYILSPTERRLVTGSASMKKRIQKFLRRESAIDHGRWKWNHMIDLCGGVAFSEKAEVFAVGPAGECVHQPRRRRGSSGRSPAPHGAPRFGRIQSAHVRPSWRQRPWRVAQQPIAITSQKTKNDVDMIVFASLILGPPRLSE